MIIQPSIPRHERKFKKGRCYVYSPIIDDWCPGTIVGFSRSTAGILYEVIFRIPNWVGTTRVEVLSSRLRTIEEHAMHTLAQ